MSHTSQTPIVIYGAGGHGRETALLIEAMIAAGASWRLEGFLVDDIAAHGSVVGRYPVLGDARVLLARPGSINVALGIGNPRARQAVVEQTRSVARAFPPLQHPDVPRFDRVTIGEGSQIHAGTILTTDITVGAFVILNRHVDVSHDCHLDDWATLAPGVTLAGNVRVGAGADLGARVTCIPGVRVGAWSVVGAGAVVTRDVAERTTAVGVPARARAEVS